MRGWSDGGTSTCEVASKGSVTKERAEGHLSLVNMRWGGSSKLGAGASLLKGNVNALRRL